MDRKPRRLLSVRCKPRCGGRRLRLVGRGLAAAAMAALVGIVPAPVSAAPADAQVWTQGVPVATTDSATSPPDGLVPIFCEAEASVSSTGALSTSACTSPEDGFSYHWTWIDEFTGGLLASQGSTVYNTATVSTASSTSGGTPGHRQATVCYTTAKAGYQTVTRCLVLPHI